MSAASLCLPPNPLRIYKPHRFQFPCTIGDDYFPSKWRDCSQHGGCTLSCPPRALSLGRGWHAVGWPPNSTPAAARPQTGAAGDLLAHPRPEVWRYRISLLQNPVTGHFWRMNKSLYFVWEMPLPLLRRLDIPVSTACRSESPKLCSLCLQSFKVLPAHDVHPKAWMRFYCIALLGSRLVDCVLGA